MRCLSSTPEAMSTATRSPLDWEPHQGPQRSRTLPGAIRPTPSPDPVLPVAPEGCPDRFLPNTGIHSWPPAGSTNVFETSWRHFSPRAVRKIPGAPQIAQRSFCFLSLILSIRLSWSPVVSGRRRQSQPWRTCPRGGNGHRGDHRPDRRLVPNRRSLSQWFRGADGSSVPGYLSAISSFR